MNIEQMPLTSFDTSQAMDVVWTALERLELTDDEQDHVNTAMAWIGDALEEGNTQVGEVLPWVECDTVSAEIRNRYISPCPPGYETVLGYLARFNPWALQADLCNPEATQRDGYWCKHRSNARGIEVVKVPAPAEMVSEGIHTVNAYPVSLLHERLGD